MNTNPRFRCVICGLLFKTEDKLEFHITNSHFSTHPPNPPSPLKNRSIDDMSSPSSKSQKCELVIVSEPPQLCLPLFLNQS